MRRLGIDNDEKGGSRAKPQTILVRILQHNPIVFLSGGKFCKAQMDYSHTIHNKSQPQIGNGNTKHQRKTSAFSNHAILKTNKTRLRHSTIMFMRHVLWISRSSRDIQWFNTQARTHTHTHTNGLSKHICKRHNIRSQQMPQPCHKRWCLNCSWSRPPDAVVRIPLGSYSTQTKLTAVSCGNSQRLATYWQAQAGTRLFRISRFCR